MAPLGGMAEGMIPQANKRIKLHQVPELVAHQHEYWRLFDDMVFHAGPLAPSPNWLMLDDVSRSPESYDAEKAREFSVSQAAFEKVSSFKNLMFAWVGQSHVSPLKEIAAYSRFLESRDVLGLWDGNIGTQLRRQDFGTLMDLNLIYEFSTSLRDRPTRILEVGGGYGRLAEAAFNVFGKSIQYVMVDAVPASLYYSKKYLTHACPDARVGSYYDADFSFGDCDIAIVPAWHFEKLNMLRYDACVNIESFQEMTQFHVDYYLNLFDRVAVDRATIYVSNAHDYFFRGTFNYPSSWRNVFAGNTPRSWTPDHPTEIFLKGAK